MSKTIKICGVQSAYLDYLRQFDKLVSEDPTQRRKFVGIILEVNDHSYCAPLSSPKPKHQRISDKAPDVVKIDDGKLGVINLNNMIPILPSAIIPIDIASESDPQYRQLLTKQMLFIRANEEFIKKKAKRLYQIIKSKKQPKLNDRCCDFLLLEQMTMRFGMVSPVTVEEVATGNAGNQ
ncbi:type III toxin-antitoxin system ToxN/AbiQ family toxin [Brevibacillus agri]|uniref:type III toxin-antitoxin system ToxN/AbiQ family toxin n=1 Tax=Brevibacillus TaxID=55080 RepID=UPI0015629D37|nr:MULTISPECIES: type III toxin-antitoxin system ToxN/AbiQ family toxin [Brevibacillus]MBE5393811.1 type III toxin-antitoxin system ToxN/AbiQ family toxin [Brevibacillus borstelensis]MED1646006.1 type III toxin-antitoxin system ToxN/AbiQ family toxin [Brevibacillus agri]MED1656319.1 type III toxin-antitoxin system ToxN/AbiQ family toxin [Brevibacillus agri]MED1689241.1 type III toxin-antitoxin system ToxN/AbiQ family toxin [Brevibacillus agri]MED1693764.1 type III toxin-antitoxin system ToxN/A